MTWRYACWDCFAESPWHPRVFRSSGGRTGHVRRTGHKTEKLDPNFQEVLEGAGRDEAADLLLEVVEGMD